jgi:hypothetical protein
MYGFCTSVISSISGHNLISMVSTQQVFSHRFKCWIAAQAKEHTDKPQCCWGNSCVGSIEQAAMMVSLSTCLMNKMDYYWPRECWQEKVKRRKQVELHILPISTWPWKRVGDSKIREKSSTTTYDGGSTFRFVMGYSCQEDNKRNGKPHKEGIIWQRRDLFSRACTPEGNGWLQYTLQCAG